MPDTLSDMRERARPIEQFYLSHPSEPFSLRLREELNLSGKLEYSATLKDRGQLHQVVHHQAGALRDDVDIDRTQGLLEREANRNTWTFKDRPPKEYSSS